MIAAKGEAMIQIISLGIFIQKLYMSISRYPRLKVRIHNLCYQQAREFSISTNKPVWVVGNFAYYFAVT